MAFNMHSQNSATEYSLAGDTPAKKLSNNFRLIEFACRDGADKVLVHPQLLEGLEAIRAHFGKPITINSGYRTVNHNRRIGGKSRSRHLYGLAADIAVHGVAPKVVADKAEELGFGGIGRYNTFTHIDVWGERRRW